MKNIKLYTRFILTIMMGSIIFPSIAQQSSKAVSGTIYFKDGKTLDFMNIMLYDRHKSIDGGSENASWVTVNYENSIRQLPFEKLKEITYEQISYSKVSFKLTTVTDMQVDDSDYGLLWYMRINDKLTGDDKDQFFYVVDLKTFNLLISKIVFNN